MDLEYHFNGLFDDVDIGFGRFNDHVNQLTNIEMVRHLSAALEIRLAQFRQETAFDSMFAVGFR